MSDTEPLICEEGGGGLFLPFLPGEQKWNPNARAFIYLMVLGWCFLGVAIVADIFMGAIEAVTSKKRLKKISDNRFVPVKVWNDTVSNLTLMALGSSAPEILLSVIELLGNSFYAGALGPSTIVGSAAFNLLCIIAVCVYVIPAGEKRTIKAPKVFAITAFFSVFAYLWLIVILSLSSPDMVEPWEGILTFLFFPIMTVIAYLADIGKFDFKSSDAQDDAEETLIESGHKLTHDDWKSLRGTSSGLDHDPNKKSRAAWRVETSVGTLPAKAHSAKVASVDVQVAFLGSVYSFPDNHEEASFDVEKLGRMAGKSTVRVTYRVLDQDNKPVEENTMDMPEGETRGQIKVRKPKADKHFWVLLTNAVFLKQNNTLTRGNTLLGISARSLGVSARSIGQNAPKMKDGAQVTISSDNRKAKAELVKGGHPRGNPGQLRFAESVVEHKAKIDDDTRARIRVQRFNGSDGELTCRYYTVEASAKDRYDFEKVEDILRFPANTTEAFIYVNIKPKTRWEAEDQFFVHLEDKSEEESVLCTDEGSAVCTVTIKQGGEGPQMASKIVCALDQALNFDAFTAGNVEWKEQFVMAFRPVSGDEDEVREASVSEWTVHFIALPWKVFFSFIPPTSYCGGWLCFCSALAFIGVVTALIGDLAALLGCCIGLPDAITAITLVALGTSLPDTFASKVAAVEDETADAAIGNVTGSNSVNVFLGLGLPWMIASLFWSANGATAEWKGTYPDIAARYPNGGFAVPAGDLVFSVITFTTVSLIALSVIVYRRRAFGAELGGPQGVKTTTSVLLVCLWLYYVVLSSWKTLTPDAGAGLMVGAIVAGLLGVVFGMLIITLVIHLYSHYRTAQDQHQKELLAEHLAEAVSRQHIGPKWQTARRSLMALHIMKPEMSGMVVDDRSDPARLAKVLESFKGHLQGLRETCNELEGVVQQQFGAYPSGKHVDTE